MTSAGAKLKTNCYCRSMTTKQSRSPRESSICSTMATWTVATTIKAETVTINSFILVSTLRNSLFRSKRRPHAVTWSNSEVWKRPKDMMNFFITRERWHMTQSTLSATFLIWIHGHSAAKRRARSFATSKRAAMRILCAVRACQSASRIALTWIRLAIISN